MFSKIFTNYKRKDSNFTAVKCSRHQLTKQSRSTLLTIKTHQCHESFDVTRWERYNIISEVFLSKSITSLQSQENIRQTQLFFFLRNIIQNIWSILFKISRSRKPRKSWRTVTECRRLRRNKKCTVVFQVSSRMTFWNAETVEKWVKFKKGLRLSE